MADAEDEDGISFNSVTQNIGPDDCHLPPAFAGIASTVWKLRESVGKIDQPFG